MEWRLWGVLRGTWVKNREELDRSLLVRWLAGEREQVRRAACVYPRLLTAILLQRALLLKRKLRPHALPPGPCRDARHAVSHAAQPQPALGGHTRLKPR